jgi:hypothetical protein
MWRSHGPTIRRTRSIPAGTRLPQRTQSELHLSFLQEKISNRIMIHQDASARARRILTPPCAPQRGRLPSARGGDGRQGPANPRPQALSAQPGPGLPGYPAFLSEAVPVPYITGRPCPCVERQSACESGGGGGGGGDGGCVRWRVGLTGGSGRAAGHRAGQGAGCGRASPRQLRQLCAHCSRPRLPAAA